MSETPREFVVPPPPDAHQQQAAARQQDPTPAQQPVPQQDPTPAQEPLRQQEPVRQHEPAPAQQPGQSPAPEPIVTDDGPRIGADGLKPVSPKLIPARYIAGIPGYLIGLVMIVSCLALWWWQGWWWAGLVALIPAITVVQGLLFTPRRSRAIGYLDGDDELTVAYGVMFRNVVTVPYGRIQSVKIDEGPVDRSYGLAKISFTTAATGAETLPGLPKDEAERLRELLTRRGIDTMAAL